MSSAQQVPRDDGERVFVALGGNLGDVAATMRQALRAIRSWPGTRLVTTSWLYRTQPVDAEGPDFLNAVAELRTVLEPEALLERLLDLERAMGRDRSPGDEADRGRGRYASRTLDLDLLMHGRRRMHTRALTLPHPRMHERAFVLAPLAEIDGLLELDDGRTAARALAQAPALRMQRLVPLVEVSRT